MGGQRREKEALFMAAISLDVGCKRRKKEKVKGRRRSGGGFIMEGKIL